MSEKAQLLARTSRHNARLVSSCSLHIDEGVRPSENAKKQNHHPLLVDQHFLIVHHCFDAKEASPFALPRINCGAVFGGFWRGTTVIRATNAVLFRLEKTRQLNLVGHETAALKEFLY